MLGRRDSEKGGEQNWGAQIYCLARSSKLEEKKRG